MKLQRQSVIVLGVLAMVVGLALPATAALPTFTEHQFCTGDEFGFTVSIAGVDAAGQDVTINIFPDTGIATQQFIQYKFDPATGADVGPSGVMSISLSPSPERWLPEDPANWALTDDGGGNWTLAGTVGHGSEPITDGHLLDVLVRVDGEGGATVVENIAATSGCDSDPEPEPSPAPTESCDSGKSYGDAHSDMANDGEMGDDGHKAGEHNGYASCLHGTDFSKGKKPGS